jgi:hypothetical protein
LQQKGLTITGIQLFHCNDPYRFHTIEMAKTEVNAVEWIQNAFKQGKKSTALVVALAF